MRQLSSSQTKVNVPGVHVLNKTALNLPRLAWIGTSAIAGQVILFLSAWLLPAVSEYRLVSDNISELVLGRYGLVQTTAFLLAGLTTLGLAWAIRKLTAGVSGSLIGSLLIGIYGAGAMLVAIFPTDRIDTPAQVFSQTPTGTVHMFTALLSFMSMIVAMFGLTRTFAKIAELHSLLWGSVLLAGSALSLFIVQGESPWVGLLQRLMVLVISAWIVMVALRIRSIAASQ